MNILKKQFHPFQLPRPYFSQIAYEYAMKQVNERARAHKTEESSHQTRFHEIFVANSVEFFEHLFNILAQQHTIPDNPIIITIPEKLDANQYEISFTIPLEEGDDDQKKAWALLNELVTEDIYGFTLSHPEIECHKTIFNDGYYIVAKNMYRLLDLLDFLTDRYGLTTLDNTGFFNPEKNPSQEIPEIDQDDLLYFMKNRPYASREEATERTLPVIFSNAAIPDSTEKMRAILAQRDGIPPPAEYRIH